MSRAVMSICAAIAFTGGGYAQDPNLPPHFGAVEIRTAWEMDPFLVDIQSGGPIQASTISPACRGWIADKPDYAIYFTSAAIWDVTISALSEADTTLVVHSPAGWSCDDDSGEGLNPQVVIANPPSGRYSIWIGSYNQGTFADARLAFSEHGFTRSNQRRVRAPDLNAEQSREAARLLMENWRGPN
jgi:hypothetical protein